MIEKKRLTAFLWGLGILIGGCAVVPVADLEWPDQAPDHSYFARAYEEDRTNSLTQTRDEYLDWVRQFYSGSDTYPLGWLDLECGFLQETEDPLQAETANKLRRLGQRIAVDWAKDNRLRLITTAMLLLWSQVIQEAVESGFGPAALAMIEADVAALLDRRLPAEVIRIERYAPWIPEIPEIT